MKGQKKFKRKKPKRKIASIFQGDYLQVHLTHTHTNIYGWIQVTLGVTIINVTPPNNLLLNSYFENLTVELHVLYVLFMHANFHDGQI